MNYPIVVYPCEEGGFVAEIPALKGCRIPRIKGLTG